MHAVISVGLFVFNHEKFVREAIEAIYAQTYRPLELIVSEDASTDGSRRIIDDLLGRAPTGVTVIKIYQDTNMGLAHAINAVAGHTSGKVIVFAAGDDVSEANRVSEIATAFSDPKVMFIHTGQCIIDESGKKLKGGESNHAVERVHTLSGHLNQANPSVLGATCAYRKELFEYFSPLKAGIIQEDVILPFRALLLGEGRCLPFSLVRYRTHGGNISFGGIDANSAEIVRRIIKMQDNRLALASMALEDLSLHLARGGIVPVKLKHHLVVELHEAEAESHVASSKGGLKKTARILQELFGRRLRCAAAIKLFFLYVIPSGYTFALWLRKKQRALS